MIPLVTVLFTLSTLHNVCMQIIKTRPVAERLERLRSDHSVLGEAGSGLSDCKKCCWERRPSVSLGSRDREIRSDLHRLAAGQVSTFPTRQASRCVNASVSIEKS